MLHRRLGEMDRKDLAVVAFAEVFIVTVGGLIGSLLLPAWVFATGGVVAGVGLAAGLGGLWRWWTRFYRSATQRRFELLGRQGLASATEVDRAVGAAEVLSKASFVRPSLTDPRPCDVAWTPGTSRGRDVWLTLERPEVVIGPPRSGKGVGWVICEIVEAPGPVVASSTRPDNMLATIAARAKVGPVFLFDPEGVSGRATTLGWSPLAGCQDPRTAQRHAVALVQATGLGRGDNAPWASTSAGILQALFHAAALGNRTIHDLHRWAQSPEEAMEAVAILRNSSSSQDWQVTLEALRQAESRIQSSRFFGVTEALRPLDVREVREILNTPPAQSADLTSLLAARATFYLVSKWRGEDSREPTMGAFHAMLLDDIAEAARTASQQGAGRLDPPLTMVLDEIANCFHWPRLPRVFAAGSGEGVKAVAVFQSRAQCRAMFGQEVEQAIWDAGVRIWLGGSATVADLGEVAQLSGEREVQRSDRSYGRELFARPTYSERAFDKPVLSVADLRRLPEGCAVLLADRAPPILLDLQPWPARRWSDMVRQSIEWHQTHPVADGVGPTYG